MPKKKKTLKQKMQSDQRHHTPPPSAHSYSLPTQHHANTPEKTAKPVVAHTITTHEYDYLSKALLKTAAVTAVIILGELLIRYITKGV